MAITKLSDSSITTGDKYISMLAGNTAFDPANYQSISTVTVGSGGQATVTFSSIPATYTHLQLRVMLPSSDEPRMRFNSDSTTSYSRHGIYGTGASSAATYGAANETFDGISYISTSVNVMITDILDYANTNKYKTTRTLSGNEENGSGTVALRSALWRNTSAITTITLTQTNSANFPQYSHFALYGIKDA
jgi:hypothetical protein